MAEFKIPTRFELFGKTIDVKHRTGLRSEREIDGIAHYKQHFIEVLKSSEGCKIAEDEEVINFFHEMVHFVLYDMEFKFNNDEYLHRNEQFINLLSLCLHQIFTTMEHE